MVTQQFLGQGEAVNPSNNPSTALRGLATLQFRCHLLLTATLGFRVATLTQVLWRGAGCKRSFLCL